MVDEIIIRKDWMRELIKEHFGDENPTDEQIGEFMNFLFDDVSNWIMNNWHTFKDEAASKAVKELMASAKE